MKCAILPSPAYREGVTDKLLPSFSSDQAAAQITRSGSSWNGFGVLGTAATVTYAFRASAPTPMPLDMAGFNQLTAAQIAAAELALQAWSDVANITFVRVNPSGYSNNAQLLFGNYTTGTQGAAAFGFSPTNSDPLKAGDAWFKTTYAFNLSPTLLSYGRHLMLHEIGHTLGFAHPGNYDVTQGTPTYAANAVYREDTLQYSVMSYWSETETGANYGDFYPSAPLLHDIAAIQRLYGANMSTRTGDTIYGYNSTAGRDFYAAASASSELIFSVWDAGGTDTLDVAIYDDSQLINLNAETFSNVGGLVGNVSIARGVVIENAVGGNGSDTIIGNAAANLLIGSGGNDVMSGGDGNDQIDGGAGADTMDGGPGADNLSGGFGADTFLGSAADLDSDVIIDFTYGDKLVISDASLANFTFALSGATLNFSGGTLSFAGGLPKGLVATAAPGGGVQLALPPIVRSRMLLTEGGQDFTLGGNVNIIGTTTPGEVIKLTQGDFVLDASFNTGGDVVVLPGFAADYTAALSGSSIVLSGDDLKVTVPVGSAGMAVQFANSTRTLLFTDGKVMLGEQVVTTVEVDVSSSGPALIVAPVSGPTKLGRLIFTQSGQDVEVGGNLSIVGSTAPGETVKVFDGNVVLDASFNAGGDTIILSGSSSAYTAKLTGSLAVLAGNGTNISIPVGNAGLTVQFDDTSSSLRFDASSGKVMLGDYILTPAGGAISAAAVSIEGEGSSQSLADAADLGHRSLSGLFGADRGHVMSAPPAYVSDIFLVG